MQNMYGDTLLHFIRNKDMATVLLKNNANTSIENYNALTALQTQKVDSIKKLISSYMDK